VNGIGAGVMRVKRSDLVCKALFIVCPSISAEYVLTVAELIHSLVRKEQKENKREHKENRKRTNKEHRF